MGLEPIKGNNGGPGNFSDRRARISAKPAAREQVYGKPGPDNILNPLWETGGLLFPYTPYIVDTANVDYSTYDPIHANQPFSAFKRVDQKEIQVTGFFTAQNQTEAKHSMAAIHFLRTVTKMYFGTGSEGQRTSSEAIDARGTPPPILLFNAYGTAMFHNIPVIVTNYNINFEQDVDYVKVEYGKTITTSNDRIVATFDESLDNTVFREDGPGRTFARIRGTKDVSAWIPTKFNVSVTLRVQNTPNRLRRHFNLNDFRTGGLIKRGGWI